LTPNTWSLSTRPRPAPGQALGQDQHDPAPWTMRPRHPPGRQGAAGALAHNDLSGGVALRPDHRALRHRRPDQRRQLSRWSLPRRRPGSSNSSCRP
jgi:hypothetical protein